MHQLLLDTEYATANLFNLLTREEQELELLVKHQASLQAEFEAYKWDFETSDLNDDFSDAHVMHAFARAHQAHDKKIRIEADIGKLTARIASREMATQAIAGAILQIAKQLISITHGRPDTAPRGDALGATCSRDVIIAARNQAMHYEEGEPKNKQTRETFAALVATFGERFDLTSEPPRSRAKEVLHLLGWSTYEQYVVTLDALLRIDPTTVPAS